MEKSTTRRYYLIVTKDSDYQLTGSTSGTPLATQDTPDGLPPSSLPTQQNNHLQGLTGYNEYNNYPTLPVNIVKTFPLNNVNETLLQYLFIRLYTIFANQVLPFKNHNISKCSRTTSFQTEFPSKTNKCLIFSIKAFPISRNNLSALRPFGILLVH